MSSDFPSYYTAARQVATRPSLPELYDYPQFQREIGRSGGMELGGYVPQTPLTMLPFAPFWFLDALDAKRLWMILNLGFLGVALWLLSKMTRFNPLQLWLLAFLGYNSLRQNFLLGQYYVFLLAVLTAAMYFLLRGKDRGAGFAIGSVIVLKLYGAPLLFFLAAKRKYRVVAATITVVVAATLLAGSIFGWHGLWYYATQILPRSIAGETLNPFHPANNTFITLFRRWLVPEPELNPHPLLDAPAVFVFLRYGFTLVVLLLPVLAARDKGSIETTEVAWWICALLLASPNTASYTFVLLLLPVALLLDRLDLWEWPFTLVPYVLLSLPVRGQMAELFPKAWLLLFLYLRFRPAHHLPARVVLSVLAAGIGVGALAAGFTRAPRPADRAIEISTVPANVYANHPIAKDGGIFYETIARERYSIGRLRNGSAETWTFVGHAFHPSAPDSGDVVYFELVSGSRSSIGFKDLRTGHQGIVPIELPDPMEPAASHDGSKLAFVSNGQLYLREGNGSRRIAAGVVRDAAFVHGDEQLVFVEGAPGHSRILRLNIGSGRTDVLVDTNADLANPAISPDNTRLVYASRQTGTWQIWRMDLSNYRTIPVTAGPCNSRAPDWVTSGAVVFSSDCNRGLNLPALYRVDVPPTS